MPQSILLRTVVPVLFSMLALTASPVQADPSGLVKKFMHEPATLWDLGMYRLELRLDEIASSLREEGEWSLGFADFEWDKNILSLGIRYIVPNVPGGVSFLCEGRNNCENFCAQKLKILGIRMYRSDKYGDVVASMFRHRTFEVQNFWGDKTDHEAAFELSKLGVLSVEVHNTVCSRDLRGGPISFTQRQ